MNKNIAAVSIIIAGAAALACLCSAFAGEGQLQPVKEKQGPDGAKLWAQTCSQCHNMRPVNSYSKAEWGVIVQHMRLRANLTGEEARSIAAFLQSTEQ